MMLSVSQAVARANEALGRIGSVWVRGEVGESRLVRGTRFFTLLDEDASLSAVRFSSSAAEGRMEGKRVLAHGYLELYRRNFRVSLVVDEVVEVGAGALSQRAEALAERLAAEGLFERKRPLPPFPERVLLITSKGGAAVSDIASAVAASGAPVRLLVADVQVQGEGAARSVANALARAPAFSPDLVVLSRGGGSAEDLDAFNDKLVVRAAFACPVPVVSAVGHERDCTLVDLAADRRVATPTAAAALVLEAWREAPYALRAAEEGMKGAAVSLVARRRGLLSTVAERLVPPDVSGALRDVRAAADALRRATGLRVSSARGALGSLAAALDALSPRRVLARGYAVLEADGEPVGSVAQATRGRLLRARVSDGDFDVRVL